MRQEYVLASGNQGKLRELSAMLNPLGFSVRPQSDWQVPEAEENATTFVENSLIKARQAASLTELPAIADDSGLVVPALNGAPGIYSARYAGATAGSQDNIDKLLYELREKSGAERNAYFYCVLVLVVSANDPVPLIATGRWHGRILPSALGKGGFGYDPVFGIPCPNDSGNICSAAELASEVKSRISHRGRALQDLIGKLRERDDRFTE
jgi:XTP/dITP diphosphohydrolase